MIVVYPEAVDKTNLWGLYRNRSTDKINGVSNYIAMEAVTDSGKFNEAFGSGTYNIDLNNYYLNIDSENDSNITLNNGSISVNADFFEGNNLVVRQMATVDSNIEKDENGNILIQNLVFDMNTIATKSVFAKLTANSNGTVIIKNNTFIGKKDANTPVYIDKSGNGGFDNSVENVIIENCTFTGFNDSAWSLTISAELNITIKDNLFTQVGRGINIGATKNKGIVEKLNKIEISGNEFYLSNKPKSNVLQISNFYDSQLNDIEGPVITFKDNYIEDANAVVILHASLYDISDDAVLEEYEEDIPIDLDNIKKLLSFTNNEIDEGIQIAISDPDLKGNADKSEEAVNYIKSIFN